MGINLEAHGYNEVAENDFDSKPANDQHDSTTAQVTETSSVNSGEKNSPANTDEKVMNSENNCCDNSTTATPEIQPVTLPEPTRTFDGQGFYDVPAVAKILGKPATNIVRWTIGGRIKYDKAASQRYKRFMYTAEAVTQAANNYCDNWDEPEFTGTLVPENISLEKYTRLNFINAWTLSNLDCIADIVTKFSGQSRKIGKKPTRFICPFCGARDMETYEDSDGGNHWRCDCLNGKTKTNDEIIAALLGLDRMKDRDEIFAYAKQFLPNVGEEHEHFSPPADLKIGIFADSDEPADKTQPVDEYEEQIRTDIDLMADFSKLPVADKRGLRDATAERFGIGCDLEWTHPNFPSSKPSPRIIFPLGDANDKPAYNAILTNTGRQKFQWATKLDLFWARKALAAGRKLTFNPAALEAELCFVTEGEFDCVSILQASEFKLQACAFGGTGGAETDFFKRLSRMKTLPMIIALFDFDANQAGQTAAADLIKKLHARFVPAVAKFLDDFMSDDDKKLFVKKDADGNDVIKIDANAILTKLGDEKLKEILFKIVAEAKPELERLAEKFKVDRDNAPPANAADPLPYVPAGNTRKKSSNSQSFSPEINDLVDRINNSATKEQLLSFLDRDRKGKGFACPSCESGKGEKGTGAVGFTTNNGPHVGCAKCHWGAGLLKLFAMKNHLSLSGKDFFKTLRRCADEYHISYDPKIFEYKPNPARKNIYSNGDATADADATQAETVDPKVTEWEGVNGKADPQLLKQLPEAVKTLEAITPENLTVEVALNSNTIASVALCKVFDWNASLAQRFFVTLDEAKKIAAAQVKSANDNAGFVAEPTDEIKMMAELDKNEIKAAVKKITADITKRQKSFAEKYLAKQAAQRRQQAIEKFKKDQTTTQKILKSCPVDLILPDNISFSANAIGLQFIDGNGNVRPQVAAISPAVVTKVFRENGTEELEYEVAIFSRGRWKRKIVPATTLTTAREVGNLSSIGLLAEDAKSLAKYFCRLLKANEETIPEITTYTRPGWHDGKFIYPGTPDADYRVRRSNIDYSSIFATHGDAQAWKKKFVDVTSSGGQICLKRIVVGACLAAPLLKVIKIPNFHLHIEGTSNFAKTPLPKLGLSVFGNPTEGGMLRGWNSTAKNRLTMAAGFCDLPQGLDELESLSKKDEESLAKNIYEFSLGIVNQANQRNGDARPAEHFRSVRVSTGERGLLKDNDKQGAFKRALTLQVEQPLFSDDEARNLHCFLSENFGHFGRQWVEYIAQHQADIKTHFEGICSYFGKSGFKRELEMASVDSIDKTNFRDVVACAVAFHHFNLMLEANGAKFDAERAVLDAQEILATLPTVDDLSDLKRSTKLLASWVVENPTRFITPPKIENDADIPPTDIHDNAATSFAGTVGKIFPNGDVGFFQNAFRRIIEKDLGLPSYVKFLRDAYTENMLNCPSRREKTRKVTIDGRKISVYIFNASELFPADQAVDDPVAQYYDI